MGWGGVGGDSGKGAGKGREREGQRGRDRGRERAGCPGSREAGNVREVAIGRGRGIWARETCEVEEFREMETRDREGGRQTRKRQDGLGWGAGTGIHGEMSVGRVTDRGREETEGRREKTEQKQAEEKGEKSTQRKEAEAPHPSNTHVRDGSRDREETQRGQEDAKTPEERPGGAGERSRAGGT